MVCVLGNLNAAVDYTNGVRLFDVNARASNATTLYRSARNKSLAARVSSTRREVPMLEVRNNAYFAVATVSIGRAHAARRV